ncbi:bacteriophage T4 gp5 trimerisation domain-containing protein, partial [Serratia microhaemolytica]|uniref:bacteriophage T4 gp5 trimerisation domain-containing protein n=1 Tax=Serratia microhaemolytica TaxID=2675110 RepID=UPI003B8339B7
PAEKTRTTLRTQTHKGEGFNELRFEDAKGLEEVYVHAQKDMNLEVLNNQQTRIDHDRSASIGHDDALVVANDRKVTVEGNQDHKTGGNLVALTEGNSELKISGDWLQQVVGYAGLKINRELVIDSDVKITLRSGGSFITVQNGSIELNAPVVNVNKGGSPGTLALPNSPKVLAAAAAQGAPFVAHCPEKRLEDTPS